MARRSLAFAALAAVVGVLALVAWRGGAAWRGWLAAAVLCAGLPSGAAAAAMMTRLIPGAWREPLKAPLASLARLWPLGALAMAPMLLAPALVYPWPHEPAQTAFRAVYMSRAFFLARGLAWFVLLAATSTQLSRGKAQRASTVGLLIYTPFGAMIGVDWLMSLDAGFASSGYGLYLISVWIGLALAIAVAAAAPATAEPRVRAVLAGVLFTVMITWAYLAFTQGFILWSGDLPPNAAWLMRRGGPWAVAIWTATALKLAPAASLGLPAMRSPRRLRWVGILCAVGAAPEVAWLALPAEGLTGAPAGAADIALFAAAVLALGLAALAWPPLVRGAA